MVFLQLPGHATLPTVLCPLPPTPTPVSLPNCPGCWGAGSPGDGTLIFPLGIPTCSEESLSWEAATPSITKGISTM